MVPASILLATVAWAQAAPPPGVDDIPGIVIRVALGALGGLVSVATMFLASAAVPRPTGRALWWELAARVVLGAGGGFAASAIPLQTSTEAWYGWLFVAGFSGSGLLGVLSTGLQASGELRRADALRAEVRRAVQDLADVAPAADHLSGVRERLNAALDRP